jgi:hypothetical protein
MDQIEADALYDERADVSWARPLLQGDVFDNVVLPGFGDEPMKVQIVNHPCSMRTAPVHPHARIAGQKAWDGNMRLMPLPELADGQNYATRFVDVTAAPVELLTRAARIASLTNVGIYVLQQRLVKHYTRIEPELELLRKKSSPVLVEAELQQDWVEEVLSDEELADDDAVDAESQAYDNWMSEDDQARRKLLQQEVNHTDMRKQARRAAKERANERTGMG